MSGGAEDYLHEAAMATNPPSGYLYDPAKTGTRLASLGVHEHWNNSINKQYSRNLDPVHGTGRRTCSWRSRFRQCFPSARPKTSKSFPGRDWATTCKPRPTSLYRTPGVLSLRFSAGPGLESVHQWRLRAGAILPARSAAARAPAHQHAFLRNESGHHPHRQHAFQARITTTAARAWPTMTRPRATAAASIAPRMWTSRLVPTPETATT